MHFTGGPLGPVARRCALLAAAFMVLLPSSARAAGVNAGSTVYGTLLLSGSMSTDTTLTMQGAFSVGQASDLTWDLLLPTSVRIDGYSEQVQPPQFSFNIQPDSYRDVVDSQGHLVRRFLWASPPATSIIQVTETVRATVQSDLSPFHSTAAYPLTAVPADVQPYLQVTPLTQLPASATPLLERLGSGGTEQSVVRNVADYVATHLKYDGTVTADGASAAFTSHRAAANGYSNLMAGLLRALHIPARVEYGWTDSRPLVLPGPPHGVSTLHWSGIGSSGGLNTWLNVYFPDAGWVPFDPQAEKFFVDTRHIQFFDNLNAGDAVVGNWTAYADPGTDPTGNALPSGSYQIAPGGGAGPVTIQSQDSFDVHFVRLRHDVKHIVLFARP